MNISIIGACGFLGCHLCQAFSSRGDMVHAFDMIENQSLPQRNCEFRKLDIATAAEIPLPLNTDTVFYLAQSPYYRNFPEHADHLFAVNALGAVKTACAARKVGVRAFFYASTGNVYAPSFDPLAEDAPVCRTDAYAASKLAGEDALALFRDLFKIVVFRPFGLFGPGQNSMLPVRIRDMIENGEPVGIAPRSGENPETAEGLEISFCHVGNAVDALLKLLESAIAEGKGVQTVNLAGGEPVSIRRLATVTAELLARDVRFTPMPPREKNLVADVSCLVAATGVEFTPFEAAMRETLKKHAKSN